MATGILKTGQVELGFAPTEPAHAVRKQDLDEKAFVFRTADVTLVAGTVTVVDALTVAGTKIRLLGKTPGGTVGAPFLFSKTAGVGFVINSTSASDTSTITYEAYE